MKEVGSPAAGKTRTLNSALPPIGQRYRALAILKSHIAGQPHRTRQSRFLAAISLRTSVQRRSRSASDGVGYSTSLRMFLGFPRSRWRARNRSPAGAQIGSRNLRKFDGVRNPGFPPWQNGVASYSLTAPVIAET